MRVRERERERETERERERELEQECERERASLCGGSICRKKIFQPINFHLAFESQNSSTEAAG